MVPIFSYVVLQAQIPKLISEMNYIWEFATDAEMSGKYGYGYATFQISVEIVSRLSDETIVQENPKQIDTVPRLRRLCSGGIFLIHYRPK